jgi:hypothetical protein
MSASTLRGQRPPASRLSRPSGQRWDLARPAAASSAIWPRPHPVAHARGGARRGPSPFHPPGTFRRPRPRPVGCPARPDSWGPERTPTVGIGYQECAIGCVFEEVGVAAREESRGRGGSRDWHGTSAHRERVSTLHRSGSVPASATCGARGTAPLPAAGNPCPSSKRVGSRGTEDVSTDGTGRRRVAQVAHGRPYRPEGLRTRFGVLYHDHLTIANLLGEPRLPRTTRRQKPCCRAQGRCGSGTDPFRRRRTTCQLT